MPKAFELDAFKSHFPEQVSDRLKAYVEDTVFLTSRYLFVRRDGEYQYGFCSHCKTEYLTGVGRYVYRHDEERICQNKNCKAELVVKSAGKGRKKLFADSYVVWYEKSKVNPDAIIARGYSVSRDYTGDYYKTETVYRLVAMYLFEPGQEGKVGRSYQMRIQGGRWVRAKGISSEMITSMKFKLCYLGVESIVEAVRGTPYQYSEWEKYVDETPFYQGIWYGGYSAKGFYRCDLVRFFAFFTKYPCVESLTKFGLQNFVDAAMTGTMKYDVVNWRGKTIYEVLGLSKFEFKQMRSFQLNSEVTPKILHTLNILKSRGMSPTFEQAKMMEYIMTSDFLEEKLVKLNRHLTFEQIVRYIEKQFKGGHYPVASSVLHDWVDYLSDCQELGRDLGKKYVIRPINLHLEHTKTSEKVMMNTDSSINVQIANRLGKLVEQYSYKAHGFILRPATNHFELFREGKTLGHCVGSFSKKYAAGETDIVLIRRADDPDTPFYTLEVQDGKIIQVEGLKRALPTDEVRAFINAFKAEKLVKKKLIKQDERLGVAV